MKSTVCVCGGAKSLYDDFIFVIEDFFDQCDLSTATPVGEMCVLQSTFSGKINLIWSYLGQPMNFSAHSWICMCNNYYGTKFVYFIQTKKWNQILFYLLLQQIYSLKFKIPCFEFIFLLKKEIVTKIYLKKKKKTIKDINTNKTFLKRNI